MPCKVWDEITKLGMDKQFHPKFQGIPWNSMELLVSAKLVHSTFHGIPWNSMELLVSAKFANFKFHGIPRNSMELLVLAKLEHCLFHEIPWNYSCHRNWRTWSSMEFHGTARVIEIGALLVPWNSMELLVSVPWNSMEPNVCYLMEPLVSSIHWVLNWDRIPWNLSFEIVKKIIFNCAGWINFRKLINTIYLFASVIHQLMFIINICIIPYAFLALLITYQNIIQNLFLMLIETYLIKKFHGTFSRVPWNFLNNIWTTPVVPWNSMELKQQNLRFHGIPWNSMEFCPDPKFYGIPWNFFHTPEFHGIPWNF